MAQSTTKAGRARAATPKARHEWSKEKILSLLNAPLLELVHQAATIHRQNFDARTIQLSSLISIKTGGCPEDCAYCPQAARYKTTVRRTAMLTIDEVLARARAAIAQGATRICLGAAWRQVRDGRAFEQVLTMIEALAAEPIEVCCTLGLLDEKQAKRLAATGVYAYNHNIDSSEAFYRTIISTRAQADRLQTLKAVRKTKMTVCSGGIIGMGESSLDRAALLYQLLLLNPPPESIPINALVPVPGTPLGDRETLDWRELVRMIATTRIVFPAAMVRLSAGRSQLSAAEQAWCFHAGANSIFIGNTLLTTPNPAFTDDQRLLDSLGLRAKPRRACEN